MRPQKFNHICENPIIIPNSDNSWEAIGTFNPSVVKNDKFHLFYRALSLPKQHQNFLMSVSTIGYAVSDDGVNFSKRRQVILPEEDWEKYGCEDPRVTFCVDKYYIFYTALSSYPFSAKGIHIGVSTTTDFEKFEKHQVTRFNSKAMALFPEKINGKFVAILTVNPDLPNTKIALAYFNEEKDIWCEKYWQNWITKIDDHRIPILRNPHDFAEVGAQPIKTEKGWLLIYSYIQNYFTEKKIFGIEALLLDLYNPSKIIAKTKKPLLLPEKQYETEGNVPNIIFPSGTVIFNNELFIYYGGADTVCCLTKINVQKMITELLDYSINL